MPPQRDHAEPPPAHDAASWRAFVRAGSAAAAVLFVALFGFVLFWDPYGRRVGPGHPPSPIMDVNQRYMYPQLARSGLFDSAVFGTSTSRLLDPKALDAALGGRFVNLAINAGTPWEQLQLATLFLRHVTRPRTLIFGLDRTWCAPDADLPGQRLTFRSFPPWLYEEPSLTNLPHLVNLKTLEISGRVALNRLGLKRDRIRGDGYEVFTPPEANYDLARARTHLREMSTAAVTAPAASAPMPALAWLGDFARSLPETTRLVVLFPPLHAGSLAVAGSPAEAFDEACKRRVVETLGPKARLVLDYRRRTKLTQEDANFWDPLHFRLPFAGRIVEDIRTALDGAPEADDGRYVIRARRADP